MREKKTPNEFGVGDLVETISSFEYDKKQIGIVLQINVKRALGLKDFNEVRLQ